MLKECHIFKQHLVIPIVKHIGNTFIFTNRLRGLKCGLVRYLLKKWHRLNTTKWTHCWGDSTQLANSVCACMYVRVCFAKMSYLLLFHLICNVCSSSETQWYHSHQFGLQCNPSTLLSVCAFLCYGLVCAAVVFSSESLRSTSVSVQSHYCTGACGEVRMDNK